MPEWAWPYLLAAAVWWTVSWMAAVKAHLVEIQQVLQTIEDHLDPRAQQERYYAHMDALKEDAAMRRKLGLD